MNRLSAFFLMLPLSLSLVLGGCSYEVDKTSAVKGPLSFATIKRAVLEPRCIMCHSGRGQWDCGDYAEVKRRIESVIRRVLEKKDMPPSPPLSDFQYDLISRWIKAGAPEKGEEPPVVIPDKPLEAKFASIHEKILVPMCIFCHSPGKAGEKVPLNTKADLINSPRLLVIPGNADESGLFLAVRPKAKKPMPPKDSGVRRLSVTEVSVIVDWINAGAPD